MFLDHFKMTAHPFAEHPDATPLFKDDRMTRGLARLEYFVQEGTIALLMGATGVGKSSLLRLFLDSLSRPRYQPVYLHLTPLASTGLLRLLVTALGEKPRLGKDRLFLQILDQIQATEATTLLLLDEAHLLHTDALIDLRLLVSSGLQAPLPLKLLLCGQEPLQQLLHRGSLADLVQRLSVRDHLRPFSKDQTVAYLDFRLQQAGASEKLFDAEAKHLLHDYTGGIPRQINNLATACLLHAATRNIQKLTEPLVHETMAEFQLP